MFELVFGLRTLGGRKLAIACILWPLCSANDPFEHARSKQHNNALKDDPCSSSLKSFPLLHDGLSACVHRYLQDARIKEAQTSALKMKTTFVKKSRSAALDH